MTDAPPRAVLIGRARLDAMIADALRASGITEAELTGERRAPDLTQVRDAISWAARSGLGVSWGAIGRRVLRDHSSIVTGFKRAEQLRARPGPFRELTDWLVARATERHDG